MKREACIRNVHMVEDSRGLQFNFGGVRDIINVQVRRILWDIYEDLKEEDFQYFVERWVADNDLVQVDGLGRLTYQK